MGAGAPRIKRRSYHLNEEDRSGMEWSSQIVEKHKR